MMASTQWQDLTIGVPVWVSLEWDVDSVCRYGKEKQSIREQVPTKTVSNQEWTTSDFARWPLYRTLHKSEAGLARPCYPARYPIRVLLKRYGRRGGERKNWVANMTEWTGLVHQLVLGMNKTIGNKQFFSNLLYSVIVHGRYKIMYK